MIILIDQSRETFHWWRSGKFTIKVAYSFLITSDASAQEEIHSRYCKSSQKSHDWDVKGFSEEGIAIAILNRHDIPFQLLSK